MAKVPNSVSERIKQNYNKMKKIVENGISRDINEADTVVIVSDILSDIFGYDKYSEITREFAIRNTYCDLAVKFDEHVFFLIEVKAIGISLNEKHIKQAVDYGANQGIDWVILTNGQEWQIYKLQFEKPINAKLIFSFDFLDLNIRKNDDLERLFILCKEGIQKDAILEFSNYKQVVNKYFITAILSGDLVIGSIRKELNKLLDKTKVTEDEITSILQNNILKRDVIESNEFTAAETEYKRMLKKSQKKKISNTTKQTIPIKDTEIIIENTPTDPPAIV